MTLIPLRAFVAILDAGLSLTRAAERVHGTQPGPSKQSRPLEKVPGFCRVRRHRRRACSSPEPARAAADAAPRRPRRARRDAGEVEFDA